MCALSDLMPPVGYGIGIVLAIVALATCVSAFYPERLRLKHYSGVRLWSNHVLFDPRQCGYCSLFAWLIALIGVMAFVATEYCL
jgi:hypothetical protein